MCETLLKLLLTQLHSFFPALLERIGIESLGACTSHGKGKGKGGGEGKRQKLNWWQRQTQRW